ncbi:MAG: nucleic acid-binding protein [Oscillospiraceae bacterium]
MRKCLRCGTDMLENCGIRVEGAGYGIVVATDADRLFSDRVGTPKVAVCPTCGELSLYLEHPELLQNRKK